MKFILPFTLLAAAVVTAQDENCEANHIVETCFASENKKVMDCAVSDYDCLCRASEALATCFNNCPKDPRAETYRSQIIVNCNNASIHGTAAQQATATSPSDASNTESSDAEETNDSSSDEEESAEATESEEESAASASASGAGASASPDSGVGHLARNTAGVLLAVAGAVVAML